MFVFQRTCPPQPHPERLLDRPRRLRATQRSKFLSAIREKKFSRFPTVVIRVHSCSFVAKNRPSLAATPSDPTDSLLPKTSDCKLFCHSICLVCNARPQNTAQIA